MKHEWPIETTTVIKQLLTARGHIEAGWCRGISEDFQGNVCAVGALSKVSGNYSKASAYLKLAIWETTKIDNNPVWYNDFVAKDKSDVLALFDLAIELAKKDNA